MNNIKQFRVFLAVIFFIASVAYLFVGQQAHSMAVVSLKMQIIPSAIAVTIGATLIWLALTFLFGRVYCSTVCPVGTLLDIPFRLRMKLHRRLHLKRFSYKSSKKYTARLHVLLIYIICLATGLVGLPALIEPWNIMKQIAYAVSPTATESAWITLGLGMATGIVAGLAVLALLLICGFLW